MLTSFDKLVSVRSEPEDASCGPQTKANEAPYRYRRS